MKKQYLLKTINICIIFLILWSLNSCALVKLREDVQFSKDSCLLIGEIISTSPLKKPIVVVAYANSNGVLSIADYTVLFEPGQYEMLVGEGNYEIFAFEDNNGDLSYNQGEWAGYYGKPDKVTTQVGGAVFGLDIILKPKMKQPTLSFANMLVQFSGGKRKPPTSAGTLANLNDTAFSAENGLAGFWAPLEFFKRIGCNIFFIEPYDATKTPILFIHGAAGSPQDWLYFINNLDRSRYQPWVFYYPSGARLDTTSFLLRTKLYDLYRKYQFESLYIVAHSMGGLVSRSAIIENDNFHNAIKLFVSISTPWGGEERAKTGVDKSPAVIPSWKDVVPDSEFIKRVLGTKLDPSIHYYLFFGHKGGGSLFRPNNDNTVTLESMLDLRAQSDALKVTGLNEDHVSILSSPEMMTQFKAVLSRTEANKEKTYIRSKGYLHIEHAFDPSNVKIPSQMALVLAPTGTDQKETQLKINPFLPQQETGAIVPNKYDVSLCALGFKTEPDKITLDIKPGKIEEVRFILKPQGMIAGYIVATTSAGDSFWGYYKDLPENVKIRTIKFTGGGITRTLVPVDKMRDREVLAMFLSSRDFAFKNQFAFFDVPAGIYNLEIDAEGCNLFSTKITAQPGEFIPPSPFRLILQ
ncbi:MAG: esterase/lipase family protein [Smithellaceae bacterium]